MQKLVSNDNDNENNNSSMPPQVQVASQVGPQMRSFQQPPFQPLGQLNQMQDWQNQQHQQPSQGQLPLSSPSPPLPHSPKLSSSNVLPKQEPPSSPTSLSLISASSSTGNSKSSKTGGSKQLSQQASSTSAHHQIRRGSGVDIKGPTPEVAQQLRFPWKLHLLLERCEYEHQQKLAACVAEGTNPASVPDMPISWLPCGKSFKVHDKERFVREVMPSFFGTQSFKTFQRNLNLWGFTRVSKGPQKDVCSHPLFLKGFPAVCQSMKRIVLKGTGRGNRAPLGGVDVSSVQAVVAAAAMQQARQQAQQHQQATGMNAMNNGGAPPQQHMQAQPPKSVDMTGMTQQNTLTHFHQQNQQQIQPQVPQNHHQQYVIENGSILPAPMPSQQKLVVLPSQPNPNASATTTVMWPNTVNQPLQQQQVQQPQGNNADLQKSLQQLSAILQQINGCNALSSASVNTNSVNTNTNSSNTNNFQQPHQPLQVAPTPLPNMMMQPQQQQQQQPAIIQPPSNPNTVVAPSPMSTQDLVALLLQRNLQQQVSQVQTNTTQPQQQSQQLQLQVPSSLFPSGTFAALQPAPQPPQQPLASVNNPYTTTNPTNYAPPPQQQQQQGAMMGNNSNCYQQQVQQVATSPSPIPANGQQQQQNQLLQLLLQQNGWSTSSSA